MVYDDSKNINHFLPLFSSITRRYKSKLVKGKIGVLLWNQRTLITLNTMSQSFIYNFIEILRNLKSRKSFKFSNLNSQIQWYMNRKLYIEEEKKWR